MNELLLGLGILWVGIRMNGKSQLIVLLFQASSRDLRLRYPDNVMWYGLEARVRGYGRARVYAMRRVEIESQGVV